MSPKRSPKRSPRRKPSNPSRQPPPPAIPSGRSPCKYKPPPCLMNAPECIEDDLKAFGFTHDKVQEMMKKPEPPVDTFAQIVHGSYARRKEELCRKQESFLRKQGGAKRKRKGSEEESPKKKQKGEGDIHLDGPNGNWVLFDPIRGWPPTIGSDPPALYEQYARFVPSNRKVVAYNLESFAISLRRTPAVFRGCTVEYSKAGPRLVKMKSTTQVPASVEQTKIDEQPNGRQMVECS